MREGHPEQRSAAVRNRRWHERARQPPAQLSALWNVAPSEELLVICRNHKTGEVSLDPLRWGLILYWCMDTTGGRSRPMPSARPCATYRRSGMLMASAAASCRWTVSLSGRPSKGRKQNSRLPSPELEGTGFRRVDLHVPIITDANDLVADIHDRMPLILATDYTRWLGEEPDPRDLMRPSPPSRCACGRFRPASTNRRMTTRRLSSLSNPRRRTPHSDLNTSERSQFEIDHVV